jgi:hypothetical protein
MTSAFLAPDWCRLAWSAFISFNSWQAGVLPTGAGVYRVRVAGVDQLAYVGQTGRNLRERLAVLRLHTRAAEMPFNDPHTAAPRLWSYRDADGLEYEASAAEVCLAETDRMALECYLLWRYRLEAGCSTLCNFGRMHLRYNAPRNRSTGVRGRRLGVGEPNGGGGPSVLALPHVGMPGAAGWMGLTWSPALPLAAASLAGVRAVPGVYTLTRETGDVVYVGKSRDLAGRLRSHSRYRWGMEVRYSVSELPPGYTPTQLLEVENDLIAGFYAEHRKAPLCQFGQRSESPVD